MIGFIITVVASAAVGWFLRGKANKKPEYPNSGRDIDLEE